MLQLMLDSNQGCCCAVYMNDINQLSIYDKCVRACMRQTALMRFATVCCSDLPRVTDSIVFPDACIAVNLCYCLQDNIPSWCFVLQFSWTTCLETLIIFSTSKINCQTLHYMLLNRQYCMSTANETATPMI
jgi:hypothetical protein